MILHRECSQFLEPNGVESLIKPVNDERDKVFIISWFSNYNKMAGPRIASLQLYTLCITWILDANFGVGTSDVILEM